MNITEYFRWADHIRAIAPQEPVRFFIMMALGGLFLVLVVAMRDEWRVKR